MRKRKHGRPIAFQLIILSLFSVLPAQASEIPRLEPRGRIFSLGRGSDEFGALEFARAALYLSGVEEEGEQRYLDDIRKLLDRFEANYTPPEEGDRLYALGEEILSFLHKAAFRSYREEQTRLDVLLDTGVHNCVSSAVLYTVFALHFDLPVTVINTSDHAFCAVVTERGQIDVETTTPYGFEPGRKKEFTDSFGRTGFTYVPPGNYSDRTQAKLIDLLGFILRNRISELQKRNRYDEAVPLAVDRYALLGTEKGFMELMNEFVNYAAFLNTRGNYEGALKFLDIVRAAYGTGNRFDELYTTLTHNLILELTDEGSYDRAERTIKARLEDGTIDRIHYEELELLVEEKRAYDKVLSEPFDEALAYVVEAYRTGKIPIRRYREFVVFLYGRESEVYAGAGRWIEAARIVEEGADMLGGDPQLDKAGATYRYNFAVTVHNRFAELFNRERYEEAMELVEGALESAPDSRILRDDLAQLEEVLSGG
jgi:tetratricopeptide (TPR) repeat protein